MNSKMPLLNLSDFLNQFERFKSFVWTNSNPQEAFVSFSSGFPYEEEHYKEVVYHEARHRLHYASWRKTEIGGGSILGCLRDAIEIEDRKLKIQNNLVDWDLRRGPKAQSHKSILEALRDTDRRSAYESLLFDFYRNKLSPEEAFSLLTKHAGRRYDFIAYLFFVKDWSRFLPISPRRFDQAFELLGVDLRTSHQCSWENYQAFIDVMRQIRDALRGEGLDDVRLIDAHSFCWMLSSPRMPEGVELTAFPLPEPLAVSAAGSQIQVKTVENPSARNLLIDWDHLRKAQAALGEQAEQIVLQSEKLRLEKAGRSDLVPGIRRVSEDHRKGYDIESFNDDGTRRLIEVKAARRNNGIIRFYLTENELQKSRELDSYFLYLVFDARTKARSVKYLPASDLRPDFLKTVLHTVTIPLPTL